MIGGHLNYTAFYTSLTDAIVLVTELSRWGRSTTDLLATLKELKARRVSLVALNGMAFDLIPTAKRPDSGGAGVPITVLI